MQTSKWWHSQDVESVVETGDRFNAMLGQEQTEI